MLRKYVTLIVLIVLAFSAAVTSADATNDVFCGDLSQSDCQILLDSAAVMDSLNAFAVLLNMNLGGRFSRANALLPAGRWPV